MNSTAATATGAQGPLSGLVVADFSRVLAGPLATTTLADLGARVIKVERPGVGDDTRAWGPPWTPDSSSYFAAANRSKESVTLDLRDAQDRSLAQELAARADVMVENFRSGSLAAYGLDHASVAAGNPGIVYCSITGFGSGAGAELPGYDFLVQAVGGLLSITGPAEHPSKVGVAVVDVLTAKDATAAILAALYARQRDGVGQLVEVNLLSSLLASLVNQASGYLSTGRSPGRMGNAHPSIAPYELLACAEAPLAVACGNDRQFARLCEVLGIPVAASDERFATNAARVAHRPDLIAMLEAELRRRPAQQWADLLTAAGVPAGVLGDIGQAFALAERLGLDPVVPVAAGEPGQVRHPVTYSATPVQDYHRPPRLGEHDPDVRAWLAQGR